MKLPSLPTLIASAVLGAVTVLNITVFHFGIPWSVGIAAVIPALAAFGISPLTGAAFRAAIDLTQAESTAVTAVLTGAQLVILQANLETGWKAALTGLVAAAAGLGFAPDTVPVVKSARAARRLRYAPARPPQV